MLIWSVKMGIKEIKSTTYNEIVRELSEYLFSSNELFVYKFTNAKKSLVMKVANSFSISMRRVLCVN